MEERFEARERELASLKQGLAETKQELASFKAETKQGMASLKQGLAETKQELASLKQSLAEIKQDVDTLLPYLEDMWILRKDILERQVNSSRDYDITKRRNCITHGGHVKSDAEAIDQEPEGSTAEKWKVTFCTIYGHGYDTIRPLLSAAPRAVIRIAS
jgi:DNA repair exonuclease SbcCD ATPase subunit